METGGHSRRNTTSTAVIDGTVDITGKPADKRTTGGWKASPFIIMSEVAERLAFYAIAVNMISYLVLHMHQPLPQAVIHVTNWVGAAFVLTLVGAFVADAYLGRFRTILIFSCIYAVGMILLTLSASVESLHPPPCGGAVVGESCRSATTKQNAFLYSALALISLGTGGIKPCVSTFGADQYDDSDEKEAQRKSAFFNWFFFAINIGAMLGITLMVYLQEKKGWAWGFGVPAAAMGLSVFVLLVGVKSYRYRAPTGSAFTRFAQVLVAACRNHFRGPKSENCRAVLYEVATRRSDIAGGARKLGHTDQYSFLDKAAIMSVEGGGGDGEDRRSRWELCTVTQVEEFKSFIRILPIWASTIALSISLAQLSTFFVSQALIMDRRFGLRFTIPPGSVTVFASISAPILIPLYETAAVPILRRCTGHRRGLTSLQRIGVGLFISIFALVSAAVVENHRRRHNRNGTPSSVFWLLPQFLLVGAAEAFAYVGQLEFFYDEATDGTRSLCGALFLSGLGAGSWLSTALVKAVVGATGGEGEGWLRNDLDRSRLDCFYWILVGINGVNFVVYLVVAAAYRGRKYGAVVSVTPL